MTEQLENDLYVYPGKRSARNGWVLGHGQGMTLRDWFAGQALAGILANGGSDRCSQDAENAYTAADAMLAARQGGDA